MPSKDREFIKKLKTKISILILIILALSYWMRLNYIDMQYNRDEVEFLTYDLIEKDSIIKNLEYKIKSIESKKMEKNQTEFKINKKKEKEKDKKETLSVNQMVDSIPTQTDTSKIND